ncbi:DNA polymerase [Streptomyces sp. NPDC056638]|uniref:DNA polymerase n=1 Tax=Streptomyces sp. NPDC056638 TaxID=3345887 RepID=UPI0036B9B4BD
MKLIEYRIKGQPVRINVVETFEDLVPFTKFIQENPVLGFDTETTGLDWWNARNNGPFRLRLAQFGNGNESYVIPVELGAKFERITIWALRQADYFIAHNGTYDLHVVEECLGIPMEELAPKFWDTQKLCHLVDPRQIKEGGPGRKLEELVKFYIDPLVADEVKGSMTKIAKRYKVKKEDIWPVVELFDEEFLLYAGMDPVFAFRLFHILYSLVPPRSKAAGLMQWEHRLAHVTAKMERTGYLLDVEYAEERCAELMAEQSEYEAAARLYGIESVNSPKQLLEVFKGLGFKFTKKTKNGNLSIDDDVLSAMDHPAADAVIKAKKAGKWRKTWFEKALAGRDWENRVHASINSCEARTARMSISGTIAAQTYPAGSGYVRHMFLADEGHVTVSIDYGNMELRVMAAASRDPIMLKVFQDGGDLHDMTAIAAFGPTPAGMKKHPKRPAGKGTNFAVGFGGGWEVVHEQFGVPEEDAKRAVKAFWDTYKGVAAFADKLQMQARRTGYIYTATGRRLPVDKSRPYAALNYYIQSSARDITARAILELDRAGYTQWMRLPIHDEIVFSFPKERAEELTEKAARIMEMTFMGLLIPADGEIGQQSWGSVLELEDSKH